jgi:adenylate cyclase
MNDAIAAIALGRRIDLTREADFNVGGVQIRPTACEIVAGGRRVRLQPRVMQVLVALARAGGEPVSRETLIEVCWGPVTVGDDALNRCIQRLRRLAETEAKGAFAIETIPRIGYRLGKMTGESPTVQTDTALASGLRAAGQIASKPSVAVMPFANLSGDPEQAYFAEGMVEEIVNALSRFKSISVIGGGATPSFKSKAVSLREDARDLGVRYVLEGSVRKVGNRVRIAVKLTDATDGARVWAERFEDSQEDVFALQDKVALSVAGRIEPTVQAAEIGRASARPTQNLGSYEMYLRAWALERTFVRANVLEALDLLNRALALDPDFAAALALAAICHRAIVNFRWSDDPENNRRQGVALAHRALKTVGDDATVLANVASALAFLERNQDAITLLDRAIALNPGSSSVWFYSGVSRLKGGQTNLGIDHLETAMRLNPMGPNRPNLVGFMGQGRFQQGRFSEAVPLLREQVQQTDSPRGYAFLAASFGHLGQTGAAAEALAHYRALSPQPVEVFARVFMDDPLHVALFLEGMAHAEALDPAGRLT